MADIEITVDGGTSKRLLTAGKYCDRNITVTATGGGGEPEPPDDGKTRLYITIPANSMPDRPPPRNQVPLYIQQTVDRGVTIDWGDGSEPETLPGTGNVNTAHTYEQAGDYVISLDPADGCELGLGWGDSDNSILGNVRGTEKPYITFLKKAYLGKIKGTRSTFSNYASLSCVHTLNELSEIPGNFLYNCYSLSSFVVAEGVKSISSYAFYSCYSLKEIHIKPVEPPTFGAANVFSGTLDDFVIYVPVGSLESYQTATNWSTYADQMQEEPA